MYHFQIETKFHIETIIRNSLLIKALDFKNQVFFFNIDQNVVKVKPDVEQNISADGWKHKAVPMTQLHD